MWPQNMEFRGAAAQAITQVRGHSGFAVLHTRSDLCEQDVSFREVRVSNLHFAERTFRGRPEFPIRFAPFPFTAVIAAASAFQYPRPRLIGMVLGVRAVRFSLIAFAAMYWGRGILRIANSPEVIWFMIGFTALCLVGSILSIMRWTRMSRSRLQAAN